MVQEGWRTLLTEANKRIKALEQDNADLRERLKRVDDVTTELAIEEQRMTLEQRTRTADILEQRLLPMAQALILQAQRKEQQPSAASAPSPKQEDGAHNQQRSS